MLLAAVLLRGLAPALAAAGWQWSYAGPRGPERWAEGFPACGGRAQSPIDIPTRRAQPDPALPPLRPRGTAAGAWSLANNGHTVVLALPRALRLHGLPRAFVAAQLHLHWGRGGRPGGSEHLLDGRRADAEMHVVHYDAERFADAGEAQRHAGGLAVLAVLLEVGAEPNAAYDNILRHLGSVRYAGQETSIPSFNVRELLPERLDHYYRYNGSLTTPPCFQGVLWSVFHQPVRIGSAQVAPAPCWGAARAPPAATGPTGDTGDAGPAAFQLAQLQGALFASAAEQPAPQRLVDNFRAPQSLNQRLVLVSVPAGPRGRSAGEIVAIVAGAVLLCLGLSLAGYFVAKRMRARRTQAQDVVFKSSTRRPASDDGHRL